MQLLTSALDLPLLVGALPLLAGVEAHPLRLRLPGHLHAPPQFAQRTSMLKQAGNMWIVEAVEAIVCSMSRMLVFSTSSGFSTCTLLSIDDGPPQH